MTNQDISPNELQALKRDGCSLIDVREPVEHAEEHVAGSQLIPLGQLESRVGEIDRENPVVIICRSGRRGVQALDTLRDQGIADAKNVTGGILAWKAAGLPVERGDRKVLPLMQQVQVVIGSGVLAGVLLAEFAHPGFIYLSGFFGAGLLFAGLSGWCGLAKLMSKMPWNRVAGDSASAGSSCAVTN